MRPTARRSLICVLVTAVWFGGAWWIQQVHPVWASGKKWPQLWIESLVMAVILPLAAVVVVGCCIGLVILVAVGIDYLLFGEGSDKP